MIVYHGSYTIVEKPDISFSRTNVDFGRGFYVTTILQRAENWGQRFKRQYQQAHLSTYQLDDIAFEKYRELRFDAYSDAWLSFVLKCRKGLDDTAYDIVIGGVANDQVFNTVELYYDGLIERQEALRRLRYRQPNLQIALRTQQVIDECMTFTGSVKL